MGSKRNRDRRNAGNSRLVPYLPGECAVDRHARRLAVNLANQASLSRMLSEIGLTLDVMNGGQHWKIRKEGFVAEWWPSSAKLVVNKHWQNGIHVHDYKQVLSVLREELKRHEANLQKQKKGSL